jgi:hypothetical protein
MRLGVVYEYYFLVHNLLLVDRFPHRDLRPSYSHAKMEIIILSRIYRWSPEYTNPKGKDE